MLEGLTHFTYGSDKEASLTLLIENAIRESGRKGESLNPEDQPGYSPVLGVPEHSHAGESSSNGASERAVQMVEDQSRTLKIALENRAGWQIPKGHTIMHWIIFHPAYLLTHHHVGQDGLTGYQRLHGRQSLQRIAEFGERILWYTAKKNRTKLAPRRRNGVFVGRSFDTAQDYIILLDGSIARARATHRVTPDIRWDASRLQRVAGTPLALNLVSTEPIEETQDPHRGPDVPLAGRSIR